MAAAEQLVDRNLDFVVHKRLDFFFVIDRVCIANMQARTCGMYGAFCLASYYHLVLDNII